MMEENNIKWNGIELINLREKVKDEYIIFLYNCFQDYKIRGMFTNDMYIMSLNDFIKDLKKKMIYKYHEFMILSKSNSDCLIGFIYSYRYNSNDGTLYTTVYINTSNRNSIYGVESALIFYDYLYNKYSIRKIYCSVYSYNEKTIKLLKNAGFELEGNLKKNKYFNNEYFDLLIFALYKENFFNIRDKLKQRAIR